jgi:hypothetical protein
MPAEIAALNDAEKRTEGPESTRGKLAPAQANAVNRKHKINRPGWTCHRGGIPIIGQSLGSLQDSPSVRELVDKYPQQGRSGRCASVTLGGVRKTQILLIWVIVSWRGGGRLASYQRDRCSWPRVYAAWASCFHSFRCAGPQQRLLQSSCVDQFAVRVLPWL